MSKKLKKEEYSKYQPKKKYTPYEINKYKKRKRQEEFLKSLEASTAPKQEPECSFTSVKKLKTLSIAVPGSILLNAQSIELQTYLAGQVARAAAIYRVDEIVVFDDTKSSPVGDGLPSDEKKWNACLKFGRILQYLECPQYLRKSIFPIHKHLEHAGLLNPLDAPHHLRTDERTSEGFREGIVSDKAVKEGKGSYINVGLHREVQVDKTLVAGTRVTVKILPNEDPTSKKLKGIIVPPSLPRAEQDLYWGYNVRLAKSLAEVVSECPYDRGYDLTIGTSDRGKDFNTINFDKFRHCLIVFGGVEGLETILESDETIKVEDISELFDYYINTCPNQGSRTIRTEEAILISLAQLTSKLPV